MSLVVLFHSGLPVSGGFIGVDVFFVISGYVITLSTVKRLEIGRFSLRDFYARRIRRLLPALAALIAFTLALLPLLGPPSGHVTTTRTGVAALLLNANHYLYRAFGYFTPHIEQNALLHTWSLSVEEQFYLAFPILLLLLWRSRKETRQRLNAVMIGLAVATTLSLAACIWWSYNPQLTLFDEVSFNGKRLAFYTAPARAWQFGVGALAALLSLRNGKEIGKSNLLGRIGAPFGLLLVVGTGLFLDERIVFPGFVAIAPTLGTALLLIPEPPGYLAGPLYSALRSRPLTWLGDLSYSWYLWHWPLVVFAVATFPDAPLVGAICGSALSLVPAWLSKRYIEDPIRYRKLLGGWSAVGVFAASVLLPLTTLLAFPLVSRALQQAPIVESQATAQRDYDAIGCNGFQSYADPVPECHWGAGGGFRAALVGDSNARHFIPVLQHVVTGMGGELRATTLSACPFVDATSVRAGRPTRRCRRWVQQSIDELLGDPPDVVVISMAIDHHLATRDRYFIDQDESSEYVEGRSEEVALAALSEQIARFHAAGSAVVLVDPIPRLALREPRGWLQHFYDRKLHTGVLRCSALSLLWRPESCQFARRLEDTTCSAANNATERLYTRLAEQGALRLRPASSLCEEGVCKLIDFERGEVIYVDMGHLAPAGAMRVAPEFEQVMQRALAQPRSREAPEN